VGESVTRDVGVGETSRAMVKVLRYQLGIEHCAHITCKQHLVCHFLQL
jgi:hypothetical protein